MGNSLCERVGLTFLIAFILFGSNAEAQLNLDLEKSPFLYTETEPDNRVSRLIAKLKAKELKLEYSEANGYLRSLLKALEIDESSQALVFSKTSLQVRYISPKNPRAIYFNDDTYVGWVHGSSLMEISTVDPKLGAAFYTVDMAPWRPKIQRANYDCLGCHATSMTQGVPGHAVRSVMASFDGSVHPQKESFVTDHSSPFSQRWGGWYVSGQHGTMQHMGNTIIRNERFDTRDNGNRGDVREEFHSEDYLSPFSDIVALMVLEHQSQMHNTLTRADFSYRQLAHDRAQLDEKNAPSAEEWNAQIAMLAKPVVESLLFCKETRLTSEVKGLESFTKEFAARGPQDRRGRSLRDFDLKTRMFKYPCSYIIYSTAFDSLQQSLRDEVYRQLFAVLTGQDRGEAFEHLDDHMREDILTILRETKEGLPLEFKLELAGAR